MFNLLTGKNFVSAWSHYFPALSISLSPAFCLSLFLQSLAYSRIFRPFVRASNKYPVTARNSSVHAGLIQLALLQHPRVYGGGKFTGVSRFSFTRFSCSFHLSPALENTRPCDRHAAVEEFFFFFEPGPPYRNVFVAELFPSGGKTLESGQLERTSRSREIDAAPRSSANDCRIQGTTSMVNCRCTRRF